MTHTDGHSAELEDIGDHVTVRLDDGAPADVCRLLNDALLAGARCVVVDLSRARLLSSSAVASLLGAHRACRARGGVLVLRGANRRTADLLNRTGLCRVIQLEPDRGSPALWTTARLSPPSWRW